VPGIERIGVLGVGRMGLPIARRLVAAGFAVTVFDLVPERSAAAGAPVAVSGAALATGSDILVTVLPGIAEAEAAMIGDEGLVGLLPAGALWLDLTSNDPRVAQQVAERADLRGVLSVGSPMAGGVTAAEAGSLRFFAGGSDAALRRARPLLEAVGTVDVVGSGVGDGYLAKLLANLLWFGQVVAVTEALLLGQSHGLSPAVLRTQLASSAGGSVFIDEYLDRLLAGDYLETFGLDRCVEELETLVSLAQDADIPFELSATISRLHREALERFGAIDGELLAARLLEERAGTTLRSAAEPTPR
jgi:3-hydroxyisobutyrate dehydrogenase